MVDAINDEHRRNIVRGDSVSLGHSSHVSLSLAQVGTDSCGFEETEG